MDLFALPIGNLLVGGAVTGMVLGIAAQQSLSNVFAGLVLLFARPYIPGESYGSAPVHQAAPWTAP